MRGRARALLALAAAGVLAGCGDGQALRIEDAKPAGSPTGPGPAPVASRPAVGPALVSQAGGTRVGTIEVPGVTAIGYWSGTLWMIARTGPGASRLVRMDRGDAEAHRTPGPGVPLVGEPTGPNGLSVGEAGIWAAWADSATAIQIDPSNGTANAVASAPGPVERLLTIGPDVWGLSWPGDAAGATKGALTLLAHVPAGGVASGPGPALEVGPHPIAISTFADALWVADAVDGTVRRISSDGRAVLGEANVRISAASRPTQITAYRDHVWVYVGDGVVELDAGTGQVRTKRHLGGIRTGTFAAGTRALWVIGAPTEGADAFLIRLDPLTGRQVGKRLALHSAATEVVTGGGAVWVVTPKRILRVVPTDEP